MTSRAWSIVSPTSATRRARPGSAARAPSTWARTHSAPARVLPAPRPPMTTQVRHAPSGGSWCGSAQNSKSHGSAIKAASLRPARKASTVSGIAEASQPAADLNAGGVEIERPFAAASATVFLEFRNFRPFLEHDLQGRAEVPDDAHPVLEVAQIALSQPVHRRVDLHDDLIQKPHRLGDEGPRQRLSGRCLNDHAASCPPLMPPAREKRKSGPGVPSPRRSPTSSSLPEGIPPTEREVKKNSIIRWLTRSAGSVAARPLFLLLGLDRPPLRHVVVVLGQRGRKDMAARAVGDEE